MSSPNPEERQVSPTVDGIRFDHRARYEWALPYVAGKSVVDYGCGVGYGTSILSQEASIAKGVDNDWPAWQYAMDHYLSLSTDFINADMRTYRPESDVAVAFEVLEHIEDPDVFLSELNAETLLASVPNEDVFPYCARIKYHYRHYTPQQFEELLNDCGWEVTEWWGQDGPESRPEKNVNGLTLVAVCKRSDSPRGGTWRELPASPGVRYEVKDEWRHPTGKVPETVMLCGLGPSKYELTEAMLRHDFEPWWDELWTINKGIDFLPQADLMWHMDDVYDYGTRHPAYGDAMRRFSGTIVGQTSLPNDGSIPFLKYPLRSVLNYWKQDCESYLHTISVPLIMAYAGMIGVKHLMLAGIDCSWDGRPDLREDGASVVMHWLGRLLENSGPRTEPGRRVSINGESALNATNRQGQYGRRWLYGWLRQPLIRIDEAGEYHVNYGQGWDIE